MKLDVSYVLVVCWVWILLPSVKMKCGEPPFAKWIKEIDLETIQKHKMPKALHMIVRTNGLEMLSFVRLENGSMKCDNKIVCNGQWISITRIMSCKSS